MTTKATHPQPDPPQHEGIVETRYLDLDGDGVPDALQVVEAIAVDDGADGAPVPMAGWCTTSGRKALRGITIGAIAGALVGAAVGAIAAAVWPDTSDSWWLIIAVSAFFLSGMGALLGAFFQVERHVGFSEAWTLTLQDVPDGSIWLLLFDESLPAREAREATASEEVRTAEGAP